MKASLYTIESSGKDLRLNLNRRSNPIAYVCEALTLFWVIGIVLYFALTHSNIIYLWKSDALSLENIGNLTANHFRLLSVYFNLFKPYTVSWSNFEGLNILFTLIALIAYTALGVCFLSIFTPVLGRWETYALGFVLGVGIMSVELEIAGIFKHLFRHVIVICYASTLVLFCFVSWLVRKKSDPSLMGFVDVVLFHRAKSELEQERFEKSLVSPESRGEKVFYYSSLSLVIVITALTFYHAILFPVTYWDSLILYVGYARKMFFENGFPEKVVAQVGIGLGANYPHLYPLMSATIATVVGEWSDVFAQVIPPFAGLLSTILIYHIVLRLSRDKILSIALALLFRSIPYGIAYFTYASDYSIAILFTTAFLFCALRYAETKRLAFLTFAALIAAFSVHINYLMWLLWGVWGVLVISTRTKIFSKRVLLIVVVGLLVSSPWYIRNEIVTGNPVYAFFPEIFGGKRINLEVLRSAEVEWQQNGDGIAWFGDTLWQKLKGSWRFFVTYNHSWKLAPVFVGFSLPGILSFLILSLRKMKEKRNPLTEFQVFGIVNFALFGLLIFYHYCIASFYLYQIIIILPTMVFFAFCLFSVSRRKYYRRVLLCLVLLIGFLPGVPMALMNFKFKGQQVGQVTYRGTDLIAFRNPLMDKQMFHELVYGKDARMWDYINTHLLGEKLLTHENRHLVIDESITLVHLDDWEVQKTYEMETVGEKLDLFKDLGVKYYLYIPNEDKHRINRRVGIQEWVDTPYLKEIYAAGENVLYEIRFPKMD